MAAEAEEVLEGAERARGGDGEQHGPAPLRLGRAPLLDRREDGARERDDRAGEGQRGGPLAGRERDTERHERAAGDDRRDDAHRAERERLVERREAESAAHAGDQAEPERAAVEAAPRHRPHGKQAGEARGLGEQRHRDHGRAARQQPPKKSATPDASAEARASPIANTVTDASGSSSSVRLGFYPDRMTSTPVPHRSARARHRPPARRPLAGGRRDRASGRSTSSRPSCAPPTARATATRSPRSRPGSSAPITAIACLSAAPHPPPSASRRPATLLPCPTRSPARLVVALSVAAVLAVFLLYTALAGGRRRRSTPSKLAGHAAARLARPARSSARDAATRTRAGSASASIRPSTAKARRRSRSSTTGSLPDLFRVGRDVVVTGSCRAGRSSRPPTRS